MAFSWGEAFKIALIGFTAVFAILFILQMGVTLISFLTRKFTRDPDKKDKKKTAQEG
jgi:Na+-transporting methylmalonyl-CoA/oxaloacetate decarboxylase gamma subunit